MTFNFIVFDFEVFKYDWLLVGKIYKEGEGWIETPFSIWNDAQALRKLYEASKDNYIYVGFNAEYDRAIYKSILMDVNPYHTSQLIIEQGIRPNRLYAEGGVEFVEFNRDYNIKCFDVKSGAINMKNFALSLKKAEGYMGEAIVESTTPFDIDRPLTDAERIEVEHYCTTDVENTVRLFCDPLVLTDLKIKCTLYDICNESGLNLSLDKVIRYKNPTLTALLLKGTGAIHVKKGEKLVLPPNLNIQPIVDGDRVIDLRQVVDAFEFEDGYSEIPKQNFILEGVPTVFANGGLHGALENVRYIEQDNGEQMFLVDVVSYYPNILLKYKLLSRSVPNPEIYQQMYEDRIKYKREGKTELADAYKLFLNATSGAMKDIYSVIYDPYNALSMTLYGQLFLIDLVQSFRRHGVATTMVQYNTDGIMLKTKDLEGFNRVIAEWEQRTNFKLEQTKITKLFQKDVNNYVMLTDTGKVKVKGGFVKQYADRGFWKNDEAIIDKGIVEYLINNVPPEVTVANGSLIDFQIITHSGKRETYLGLGLNGALLPFRTNRVFRTTQPHHNPDMYGLLQKITTANSYAQYPNLSANVSVVNEKLTPEMNYLLDIIDKEYYVKEIYKWVSEFSTNEIK